MSHHYTVNFNGPSNVFFGSEREPQKQKPPSNALQLTQTPTASPIQYPSRRGFREPRGRGGYASNRHRPQAAPLRGRIDKRHGRRGHANKYKWPPQTNRQGYSYRPEDGARADVVYRQDHDRARPSDLDTVRFPQVRERESVGDGARADVVYFQDHHSQESQGPPAISRRRLEQGLPGGPGDYRFDGNIWRPLRAGLPHVAFTEDLGAPSTGPLYVIDRNEWVKATKRIRTQESKDCLAIEWQAGGGGTDDGVTTGGAHAAPSDCGDDVGSVYGGRISEV